MTKQNVSCRGDEHDRLAISVEDAARRLSVSASFVRLEIARGRIRPARPGRRVLVSDAEIDRYLADKTD